MGKEGEKRKASPSLLLNDDDDNDNGGTSDWNKLGERNQINFIFPSSHIITNTTFITFHHLCHLLFSSFVNDNTLIICYYYHILLLPFVIMIIYVNIIVNTITISIIT